MTRLNGGATPQLTWSNIIATLGFGLVLAGASWTIFQTQFANVEKQLEADRATVSRNLNATNNELIRLGNELKTELADVHQEFRHDVVRQEEFRLFLDRYAELLKRVDTLNERILEMASKSAHNPVEAGDLNAQISATDKRLDIVQAQIADINRQIAAAILLGDAGADRKKALVPTEK